MAGAGVTKPTAFDGMFPEWVPTDVDNPFGVTGGGKQEGVAPRIEVEQIGQIEIFAGTPDQLVIGRGGHSLRHGGAIFPDTLRWLWSENTP